MPIDLILPIILASILCSIISGIMGIFVRIKQNASIIAGISHMSFGGIGFAHFIGFSPFLGAMLSATIASAMIGYFEYQQVEEKNILITLFWTFGMALGSLLMYATPGYLPDLASYLFGNILAVSWFDIYMMTLLLVLVMLFFWLFGKEWTVLAFDRHFLILKGLPAQSLNILFYIFLSLSIVLLIRIVGIILVMAMLTIPASISFMLVKSMFPLLIVSVAFSFLSVMSGLVLSYFLEIPTGATIVIISVILWVLVYIIKTCIKRWSNSV